MDKLVAINKVLAEPNLARLQQVILLQMILHSGADNVCVLSKAMLAEFCKADRGAVGAAVKSLEEQGYVSVAKTRKQREWFVPFPYNQQLITMHDGQPQSQSSRLTVTPEMAKYGIGVFRDRESSLTLQARDAQDRHDMTEFKKLTLQVDMVLEWIDALEKFSQRVANR